MELSKHARLALARVVAGHRAGVNMKVDARSTSALVRRRILGRKDCRHAGFSPHSEDYDPNVGYAGHVTDSDIRRELRVEHQQALQALQFHEAEANRFRRRVGLLSEALTAGMEN